MLVYGKQAQKENLGLARERLRARISRARAGPCPEEQLRTILVLAGQLEQALADTVGGEPAAVSSLRRQRRVTALAAEALLQARDAGDLPPARGCLELAEGLLGGSDGLDRQEVTVRVPEGFAYYALFPEQYAAAAEAWLRERAGAIGPTLVVGIRSIGTSLAALVAARLRLAGWPAISLTVRPGGHPFAREVELPAAPLQRAAWGLVVDEGPGLSGSSMAAVALALERGGLPADRLALLPGHPHGPGPEASAATRASWGRLPTYHIPLERVWLGQRGLQATLLQAAGAFGAPEALHDLGGGRWRSVVCRRLPAWPPSFTAFERSKYLCRLADGTALLFKYAGLCAAGQGLTRGEAALERLRHRAGLGAGPAPLGLAHGFVVRPWVEAEPLRLADLDEAVLERLGSHVAQVAGSELDSGEAAAAAVRLQELLHWNTRELIDEEAAGRARQLAPSRPAVGAHRYGDGRLGPIEWLRPRSGPLLKVDAEGHDDDHTMVGAQPLAWDLAGAVVEWALPSAAQVRLLQACRAGGGPSLGTGELRAYRAAYAGLRAGQCLVSLQHGPPADEIARLRSALGSYRAELQRALTEGDG